MSKLYKKVTLLVSRAYSHGGDGIERGGLVFFRSEEEYQLLATERGWNDEGESFGTSWCVKPVLCDALVEQKYYAKFMSGSRRLTPDMVFFPGNEVQQIAAIGGW